MVRALTAGLAQACREQCTGQMLLIRRHFAQRQTLALLQRIHRDRRIVGNEVPVRALVRIELKHCFGALIGVERSEKPVGALRDERCRNDARRYCANFMAIPGVQCSSQEQNGQTQLVMDAHRFILCEIKRLRLN
jgi:hypothetical protein